MKIEKRNFGRIKGENIFLYRLINNNGMEVCAMNYGATLTSLTVPDAEKGKINLVCGFNNLDGYLSPEFLDNSPYFGATVGRYAATIQDGCYETYELSKNAGEHTLHGGAEGFDKKVWEVKEYYTTQDLAVVEFILNSSDGDQGFPGHLKVSLTFKLSNDNDLSFNYKVTTDQRTPISLTNHTYYNLSGFAENVENHFVKINSTKSYPLDAKGNYSENIIDHSGNALDLSKTVRVGDVHQKLGEGIECYYLFDKKNNGDFAKVAEVTYPSSNRKIEISTSEPGMLFYTAKYTSDFLRRESGEQYGKYCAFCCETHRLPNGPNIVGAPDIFLERDETYRSKTSLRFTF